MGFETMDGEDWAICDHCRATVLDTEIPTGWIAIDHRTARRRLRNEFIEVFDVLLCGDCKGTVRYTLAGGIEEKVQPGDSDQMPLLGFGGGG